MCNDRVMHETKLISAKEKAAELGISRSTLSRWVEANKITPAYIGEGDNGIQLFTPESSPTARPVDDPPVSAGRAPSSSLPADHPKVVRSGN